jgi:uncharacterized protein (TIGR03435 family)
MRRMLIISVLCTVGGVTSIAQQTPAPRFEAASIKPTLPGAKGLTPPDFRGNRFTMTNLPAVFLLVRAFDVRAADELIGIPSWLNTERYDVVATAPEGSTARDVMPMLAHLLETRFNLRAHKEAREQPAYVLTIASADGSLGSQLRRSEGCLPRATCDGRVSQSTASYFHFKGAQWSLILEQIASALDHRLIDRTGLSGAFDADLEFARKLSVQQDSGVDIFAAVRQQLGLKLEQTRARVDVVVIDAIERPTPD